MKVRALISLLERNGWRLVRRRGSHRQFKHEGRTAVITVAGNDGAEVPIGTLKAILKHAGLEVDR